MAVTSGASQSIGSLTDGAVNSFPSPVQITTSWDLDTQFRTVRLYAYFATPNQALGNGYEYIPSSRVTARTNGSGAFAPFTGNGVSGAGTAGGSYLVFGEATNKKSHSRTDVLDLRIDLTGTTVSPGTYTGTMFLRAVTQ